MDKILQGDLGDELARDKDEKGDGEHGVEFVEAIDVGQAEFIMDLPNISSIDLCVSVFFQRTMLMTEIIGTS